MRNGILRKSPFSQVDTYRKVILLGILVSIAATLLIEGYNFFTGAEGLHIRKVSSTLIATFVGGVAVGMYKKIRYDMSHRRTSSP